MPQAGWYEDPRDSDFLRLWNGTEWTDSRRLKPQGIEDSHPPRSESPPEIEPHVVPIIQNSVSKNRFWITIGIAYACILIFVLLTILPAPELLNGAPDFAWTITYGLLPLLMLVGVVGTTIYSVMLLFKQDFRVHTIGFVFIAILFAATVLAILIALLYYIPSLLDTI
jgi:hypothetical protein